MAVQWRAFLHSAEYRSRAARWLVIRALWRRSLHAVKTEGSTGGQGGSPPVVLHGAARLATREQSNGSDYNLSSPCAQLQSLMSVCAETKRRAGKHEWRSWSGVVCRLMIGLWLWSSLKETQYGVPIKRATGPNWYNGHDQYEWINTDQPMRFQKPGHILVTHALSTAYRADGEVLISRSGPCLGWRQNNRAGVALKVIADCCFYS